MDEDVEGKPLPDGTYEFTCDRSGHPGGGAWTWPEVPAAPEVSGVGRLAVDLNLVDVLPDVIRGLGPGWFEVGLVERAYARREPDGFAQMVSRWGHSAQGKDITYSATTYLARTLGTLAREGLVAYHGGVGTGRWSYNSDISWWASVPAPGWEHRTSWADVLGDDEAEDPCTEYLP